jgi:hypothetical protein
MESNETSQKWHHGYGGGIWLSPFQMAVVTLTYGRSSEDEVISFKLGFSSSNIFYNHYKIISKNKLFWS